MVFSRARCWTVISCSDTEVRTGHPFRDRRFACPTPCRLDDQCPEPWTGRVGQANLLAVGRHVVSLDMVEGLQFDVAVPTGVRQDGRHEPRPPHSQEPTDGHCKFEPLFDCCVAQVQDQPLTDDQQTIV